MIVLQGGVVNPTPNFQLLWRTMRTLRNCNVKTYLKVNLIQTRIWDDNIKIDLRETRQQAQNSAAYNSLFTL
jgi:uncharacterized protein with HEPN domain